VKPKFRSNRTHSNKFTIDGADNNDQSLSIPRQNLPPEATGEFLITNTPSAEFGRNAGSYVNLKGAASRREAAPFLFVRIARPVPPRSFTTRVQAFE